MRLTEQEEAFRREVDEFIRSELPPGWTEDSLYWPGGYGARDFLKAGLPMAVLMAVSCVLLLWLM